MLEETELFIFNVGILSCSHLNKVWMVVSHVISAYSLDNFRASAWSLEDAKLQISWIKQCKCRYLLMVILE